MTNLNYKKFIYFTLLIFSILLSNNLDTLSDRYVQPSKELQTYTDGKNPQIYHSNPNDEEVIEREAVRKYVIELKENDPKYKSLVDAYVVEKYEFIMACKLWISVFLLLNAIIFRKV